MVDDSSERARRWQDASLAVIFVLVSLAFQELFSGLSHYLFPANPDWAADGHIIAGGIFLGVGLFWTRKWVAGRLGSKKTEPGVAKKHSEDREFDERLEKALRKHLKTYFDFFDKKHPDDETTPLGWKDSKSGEPLINPDLVNAYVSLRAERRATRENARLQQWLIAFAAISTLAIATQTLLEALRIYALVP